MKITQNLRRGKDVDTRSIFFDGELLQRLPLARPGSVRGLKNPVNPIIYETGHDDSGSKP